MPSVYIYVAVVKTTFISFLPNTIWALFSRLTFLFLVKDDLVILVHKATQHVQQMYIQEGFKTAAKRRETSETKSVKQTSSLQLDFSPVEGEISQLAECLACGWSRCCVVSAASTADTAEGIVSKWTQDSNGSFCHFSSFPKLTFLMLPPDFLTISSSTMDWRQMLIMMAWGHGGKRRQRRPGDRLFRERNQWFAHFFFTCWLVMVTHWRRSLLIRYSKASSSFTSHLVEPEGLLVPLATGTCCTRQKEGWRR